MAGAVLTVAPNYGAARIYLYPAWQYCFLENTFIGVTALYITTLMPLSCALLHSAAYLDDRSALTADVLFTRGGKARYWGAGIFLSFISTFLLTLLAMVLCQALLCLALPLNSMKFTPNYPTFYAEETLTRSMLFGKELAAAHPYLYLFLYDLLPAAFAGLVAVASYALGMLLHKRVLVVFLPGLLIIALNFFLEFAGKSSYCPYHVLQSGMRFHGIALQNVLTVFLAAFAAYCALAVAEPSRLLGVAYQQGDIPFYDGMRSAMFSAVPLCLLTKSPIAAFAGTYLLFAAEFALHMTGAPVANPILAWMETFEITPAYFGNLVSALLLNGGLYFGISLIAERREWYPIRT